MSSLEKNNSPMQYQKEEKRKTPSSCKQQWDPLIQPESTGLYHFVLYYFSKHTAPTQILLRDLSRYTGGKSNSLMKLII